MQVSRSERTAWYSALLIERSTKYARAASSRASSSARRTATSTAAFVSCAVASIALLNVSESSRIAIASVISGSVPLRDDDRRPGTAQT